MFQIMYEKIKVNCFWNNTKIDEVKAKFVKTKFDQN